MKIGLIGIGFVGGAIRDFFIKTDETLLLYDKYNDNYNDKESILEADMIFICVPTPHMENNGYDISAIEDSLSFLDSHKYNGLVIIKSTVLPGTIDSFSKKFKLKIIHNPEFLTARTASKDFENQKVIIIGAKDSDIICELVELYTKHFPDSIINIVKPSESESIKIMANSFYSTKIQILNEFYGLCQALGIDYEVVKNNIVGLGWVNNMHTSVPGHDGKLSYGGACFIKDTRALLDQMKKAHVNHQVLEGVVNERNIMRDD